VIQASIASALRGGRRQEHTRTATADGGVAVGIARRPTAVAILTLVLALSTLAVGMRPESAQADSSTSRNRAMISARIDSGSWHSCAIDASGALRCWGYNGFGELGYGNIENIGDNETPNAAGPVDLGAGRTAKAVTTGEFFSCAILDNGTVRCWGPNAHGRLGYPGVDYIGDNETPAAAGPVDLGAGRTATAISAGSTHVCAILDNGSVRCWGNADYGQLGYGNKNSIGNDETPGSVGPVNLGAGRTAVAISGGYLHTCALLDNGTVRCWGSNAYGQLGTGTGTGNIGDDEMPNTVPPVDLGPGRTAVAISAGTLHTCALLDNGTVKCWGNGEGGRLGYGNTSNVLVPSAVGAVDLGAGRTAIAIVAAERHSCAILDNGALRCWGEGFNGQLGYGNTENIGDNETPGSIAPVDLGADRNALTVTGGKYFTCALLDNGTTRCWGESFYGQLGYANTTSIGDDETPGLVGPVNLGSGHGVLATAAGASHSCALFDTGKVRCWGNGADGRLGYGNSTTIGDDENPGAGGNVDLGGRSAVEITAGEAHTCALLDNGTVRCWGYGEEGRLGYGNTQDVGDNETPGSIAPVDLGGVGAADISAGGAHTCASLANGTVRCWGVGVSGRLGYGSTTTIGDNETPASIAPAVIGRNATSISAGGSHTCASVDDGGLRCWGLAANGQLGYANTTTIGDNETPSSAGAVSVGRSATSVAAGFLHTCARLDDGTLRCWGAGSSGRLGYANTTTIGDNEAPSSVGTVNVGRSATAVATGLAHTCALLDNGTVRCWGLATSGQLGYANTTTIGDNEAPSLAGPVDLGRSALSISTGSSHNCAVLDNGTVRCWGLNADGQLGYGNTTNIGDNETPASVGPLDFDDEPPVAVNDSTTVNEDVSTAINVLANDTDADGGTKAIIAKTNGAHGTVTITGGGTGLTYLSSANYCGPDSFTYELNGGSTATVSVTVTCVDDGPVAANDSATLTEDAAASAIDVLANDTDIDGGPKSIQSATDPAKGTVAITGGGAGLTYQPDPNYCNQPPGTTPDTFSYELNGGSKATVSITVTCVDDPPVAVNDSATINEDATATAIGVLANDTDVDSGTKSIASKSNGVHGTVTITGGGTGLTYLPDANYCGPDSFTYTLNGGSTGTVSVTVTCIDDLPVAVNDSATVTEDAAATAIDVLANDTDIDAGPKSIQSATDPAKGTVAITGGGAGLTYQPDPNYCNQPPGTAPDTFSYTLNGGSKATASITVTCVDDGPTAVDDSATVAEDAAATAVSVLSNDTDVDGGPKTIAAKSNGDHGVVAITGGGTGLTYLPDANYCGPDSFTYELNGGSTATVSVTVTCDNDSPIAVNDSATIAEDAPATQIDVLANDTDVDNGPKSVDDKTDGSHGVVVITGPGSALTYQPDPNYCGSDSFTYTLNGGSTAAVSVTITCSEDSPVAVDDASTLVEDSTAATIDVLANDTDVDGGPKAVNSKSNGAHGAVAITGGGTGVSYLPDANYCGPDSFTYTLNGGSTATVSMTVTCADDAPVAVDDSATITEDVAAAPISVLGNDTDIDGGPKAVNAKTDGVYGDVAISGGGAGITYQPDPNYCGSDSFTYTLNGGSTASVSVTITCVDDSPVAVDDSGALSEDAAATAVDVLANDTDVDGGPKTINSEGDGAHGNVSITGGGSGLTYQPAANYCGPDSFTYTVNGGSQATVSVTVSCVDDAPAAVNDSATLDEDATPAAIGVLANDADIDGGPKSIAAKSDGSHGLVAITGGGSGLTYAPSPNYCGPDSFTYELNGGSQATVSVTVSCVDDAPDAVNDADTVLEDAPATAVDVLANDTDGDGGPRSVIGRTNGAHGTVSILGAGAGVTYAPNPNYCGPDSFTYTLNGGSSAAVSMTVTCVDDAPPPGQGSGPPPSTTTSGGSNSSQTSSAPIVNITPGIGVVSGRRRPRVAVKGAYAFFTLTCKLTTRDCRGIVRITANVPSIALGPTMRNVTVVKGNFRVGSGRSVLVRAKLTKLGRKALERKRSLRGVAARMAIVDTGNGEKGKIEVNLVRRPKASLLPTGTKRAG
jgi:alpha-tubulin suppressor-like RCC1 family protein